MWRLVQFIRCGVALAWSRGSRINALPCLAVLTLLSSIDCAADEAVGRRPLILSLPRDGNAMQAPEKVYAINVSDPNLTSDRKAYALRIMHKIGSVMDQSVVIDEFGVKVCLNAEIQYRLIVRDDGEVRDLQIRMEPDVGLPRHAKSAVHGALTRAVYDSAPYAPFSRADFDGSRMVGFGAAMQMKCKRQPVIRVGPPPLQ